MRLDMYDNFPSEMKAYLSNYGWHFSKAMCEFAVSGMEKEDGNGKKVKIQPYTKDQVDALLKQYGVELKNKEGYDYVYAANMCKADYLNSSVPNESYLAKFVKDYVDDPDAPKGKTFGRFYADCIASGKPIMWGDML